MSRELRYLDKQLNNIDKKIQIHNAILDAILPIVSDHTGTQVDKEVIIKEIIKAVVAKKVPYIKINYRKSK